MNIQSSRERKGLAGVFSAQILSQKFDEIQASVLSLRGLTHRRRESTLCSAAVPACDKEEDPARAEVSAVVVVVVVVVVVGCERAVPVLGQ